ncbi:hypothetical protein CDD81_5008 [Ophiocordyceps australis]|uniref:Uncharacterized protein n=1 Tax=Ophiocordyceps australis TaxID=1399860 RepID=A0A2C5Y936_9HYPO|nr:hypothetical protein CDD81_5008 [Ophiocordyceps australis]
MQDTDATADSSIGIDDGATSAGAPHSSNRRYQGRRQATLYDAVAGRVNNSHALMDYDRPERGEPDDPGTKQTQTGSIRHSLRATPLRPDEVLFRRKDAPIRYAEHDVYTAYERDVPRRDVLPESDLLEAIHAYASHFYGAMQRAQSSQPRRKLRLNADDQSMDETALLAFGILVEEAGREALGRGGDLVFTEPAWSGDEVAQSQRGYRAFGSTSLAKRGAKRRKLSRPDEGSYREHQE